MLEHIARLLETASIGELKQRLDTAQPDLVRPTLLAEFDRLVRYRNIEEWNALVRVCEALALVGWGERQPVEALAERWVNGSWYTTLSTREFEKLSGHGNTSDNTEAEWAKRGNSFVLRGGDDTLDRGIDGFASQRLPLPKNPVRVTRRVANHQKSATAFVEALRALNKRLNRELSTARYGEGFDYVEVACVFSNHDDEHTTVRGEYFHDAKDVPLGLTTRHYIRPRLGLGKLVRKHELWHWRVDRHFTRAEGELPLALQQRLFAEDLLSILETLKQRLAKKKLRYDVGLLKLELERLLETW